MKKEWTCTWQLIPGGTKQTKTYPTEQAARKAMAQVLKGAVDLSGYIDSLRKEKGEDCGSSADFLEKFLSDLTIPNAQEDVPPHLEIPDHCLLEIHPCEGFRWGYMRGECPLLQVSHVLYVDDSEPFVINFGYENPEASTPDRVYAVHIKIEPHVVYGTSAYPLMILRVLDTTPKTHESIIQEIMERYKTKMDRKAVGRHLKLLKALDFPIKKSKDGYFIGNKE